MPIVARGLGLPEGGGLVSGGVGAAPSSPPPPAPDGGPRRRFAPRLLAQLAGVQSRQSFAGSMDGRVRRTYPVAYDPDVRAPAYKQQAAKDLLWWVDTFYVDAGTTTVALDKYPYWKSEDLKLQGEGLFRDLEWTRDGKLITLDPSVLAGIGSDTWILTAHYQWLRDAQPAVIEG